MAVKVLNRLHLDSFVTIRRDKMKIDQDVIRNWFKEPVDSVVEHVKKILKEPGMKGVNTILLVGGFGESQYVHEVFKKTFTHQSLIVPQEAGIAVLKGAVRFGHEPKIVSSRVMNYTYGIAVDEEFDESKHSVTDVKLVNGTRIVKNIFGVFVSVGQMIRTGQEVRQRKYSLKKGTTLCNIRVFNSLDPNPKFTTDPNCKNLGTLTLDYPEVVEENVDDVEVIFVFGETELVVKARLGKSGQEFHTTINCLQ